MSWQIEPIIGLAAGLAVLLSVFGYAIHLQRARVDARLRAFVGGAALRPAPRVPTPSRARGSGGRSLLRGIRLGARPSQLAQAGVSVSPRGFLRLQLIAGSVGCVLVGAASTRFGLSGMSLIPALAAGALGGLVGPRIVLRLRRKQRLTKFESQFANALDLIANSMQAGLSLTQALEMVSRDMPAPLAPEFAQTIREMGLGLPVGEALDGLAERVPLRDVEIFVSAVHIQYRTGGHLSEVLRTIAGTVRERVNLRGEIRSLTAQQRFSAYLVSGLPVFLALLLKFINPAYFEHLLEPGLMRVFVILAGLGIAAGFYFMMRIADIEV
ncbi:MAG TPA: type II secretion system F family protein [Chloroflexota bacterium]|nr:type II secretion system F family protein [Chloroflexota bacterium]